MNWLERLDPSDVAIQFAELRRRLGKAGLTLKKNGKFATLNVGRARAAARELDGRDLRVLHEPKEIGDDNEIDDSHCGIYDIRPEDEAVAYAIAKVVENTFPALEPA